MPISTNTDYFTSLDLDKGPLNKFKFHLHFFSLFKI